MPGSVDANSDLVELLPGVMVHPSSLIEQPVTIGRGTRIWHFCHVMRDARIGEDASLGQNCFVASGVVIGCRVKVQNNVSLYQGVELEDEVFCGPSVVFTNVRVPRSAVPRKDQFARTLVGRGASLGANATLVAPVTLGQHSFVAAGAVVTHDVPAFALVAGVPARVVGWVGRHGERLEFDARGYARCPATGERYQREGDAVRLLGDR